MSQFAKVLCDPLQIKKTYFQTASLLKEIEKEKENKKEKEENEKYKIEEVNEEDDQSTEITEISDEREYIKNEENENLLEKKEDCDE
jgi:hypothetical protein